ncbi:hypothetical protein HVX06_21800 (plasmid) [Enterobacter sp. RHB15-C17]|uniref:Uncharacterized protein n=1 Tax=Lelliottia amnigena TaxID=61646 RepID=A0AAP2AGS4_LELAM|nr:hypothetical protein [Lelliottia amnigena]MBL5901474.1 hypothetical protein [Lelliottia amnigena]MBL5936880.1 hypothetical protein [Lelliottia amnigena]QMM55174.1 hypothetical protein HVX06_21800 [Enterobacter sp. RHB15-C17]
MHTRNVNVKTAAPESSRKMGEKPVTGLTYEQAADLFSWVVNAAKGELQPAIFNVPAESVELSFMYDDAPDYFSVWFIKGYPVAAGVPSEHYFRVITSFITLFSGVN